LKKGLIVKGIGKEPKGKGGGKEKFFGEKKKLRGS